MNKKLLTLPELLLRILLFAIILVLLGNLTMVIILKGEMPTWRMILYGSANSIIVGGAFAIGLTLLTNWLDRKVPWLDAPVKRLIVQFVSTVVFSLAVIALAIPVSGFFMQQQLTPDYLKETAGFMVKIAFIFIFTGSLITNAILFFKNWKEAAVQQEKMKREQLALQYETLKSQVNPHFLFNNLNSLTSLIGSDPEKAISFVKKLSEVYRYVLDQKNQELVPLETEMKFVESYIFLQKIRFGANLTVETEVTASNFKVIPLSVQMLVENAVKHNEISDKKPLTIRIFSDDEYLTVENPVQKKTGSEGTGSGLKTIASQYDFFTDREVKIESVSGKFIISLPLITA